jgi:predicted transglutaminase-like cysteine proteinase
MQRLSLNVSGLIGAKIILCLASLLCAVDSLAARNLQKFTTPVEDASPPAGWLDFCGRHQEDCAVPGGGPDMMDLTPETWTVLEQVNASVNRRVKEVEDRKHYGRSEFWDYPSDGSGDCEDYVLEKRRQLIRAGIPAKAILIAIVWTKQDNGHAVLIVRTDQGAYALDNLRPSVTLWSLMPYDYVKRQSEADPNHWLYIDRSGPQRDDPDKPIKDVFG